MNIAAKVPAIGDNRKALITADQLKIDFAHIEKDVTAALALANKTPSLIEDDEDIAVCREAVKALMKEHKRAEAIRVETKNPYLDAERVVDSFFAALKKQLADVQAGIEARAKHYLDKKAADERARREAEAAAARAAERKRQEEAAAAATAAAEERRRAEEAEAAAAAEVESEKRAEAEAEAAEARAAAEKSAANARAARQREIDAAATTARTQSAAEEKPADLARTRVGDGMATLQQGFDFRIDAYATIDLDALRPYFSEADIEKAIRRYVGIHKGDKPLRGVTIFPTTKAQMR